MKLTRANRLALYVSVGASATLTSPALATAETPAASALPVQPCLASSSLPVANPLPCQAGAGAARAGQPGEAGAPGANGSASAAVNGNAGVNGQGGAAAGKRSVKVKVHRTTRRRHHRVSHSRPGRKHTSKRHHS